MEKSFSFVLLLFVQGQTRPAGKIMYFPSFQKIAHPFVIVARKGQEIDWLHFNEPLTCLSTKLSGGGGKRAKRLFQLPCPPRTVPQSPPQKV